MSSEHVEVLRELRRFAVGKEIGALDAAIASLSAPQPPAEALRCTCPSGDGSLRWPCPAHPPEAQPVYVGVDLEGGWIRATTPPSAPVGVAADILRIVDTAIDVCNDRDRPAMAEDLEAVRLYVEQASAPLAQQPAAVALSREELDTCRQWFDSVQDTNGGYLTPDDYVLAEKLYRSVGMRVPDSIGRVAAQQPAAVDGAIDAALRFLGGLQAVGNAKAGEIARGLRALAAEQEGVE